MFAVIICLSPTRMQTPQRKKTVKSILFTENSTWSITILVELQYIHEGKQEGDLGTTSCLGYPKREAKSARTLWSQPHFKLQFDSVALHPLAFKIVPVKQS